MAHALKDYKGFKKRQDIFRVDPKEISVRKGWNPREDFGGEDDERLKNSIIANGVIIPLSVKKNADGGLDLINGERRLRATLAAIAEGNAIDSVPVLLVRRTMSESEQLFHSLITNDGKPLNPIEEARAYQRLVDWGLEVSEVAERIGKSASMVYERLKLIDASPELKKAVIEKKVPLRQAANIVSKSNGDADKQKKAIATDNYRPRMISGKYEKKSDTILFKTPAKNGSKPVQIRMNVKNVFNKDFLSHIAEKGVDVETIKFSAVIRADN